MARLRIYAKPSNLFRYRPLGDMIDQELKAIEDNFIFCASFASMNDPMEGSYRMSARFLENPRSESKSARVKRAFDRMGIASFSEVYDHEPMWAHYAEKFTGMCVRYSLNKLISGLDDSLAISRMMYSENEPVLLDDNSPAKNRARMCLSSKTVRWASEREWRLFKDEIGEAHCGQDRAATKIYLGSRVAEQDERRVVDFARRLRIPIAKMSVRAYSIEFNLIPRPRVRRPPRNR